MQLLCEGLANSLSLITLRAAWNGFGELSACRALKEALRQGSTLKALDVSQNRIDYEGACLLAQVGNIRRICSRMACKRSFVVL